MDWPRPACSSRLKVSKTYERVAPFLYAILSADLYKGNIFLSKQSVIFLRETERVYSAIGAVNRNVLVTDISGASDTVLQVENKPLMLTFSPSAMPKLYSNLQASTSLYRSHASTFKDERCFESTENMLYYRIRRSGWTRVVKLA